MKKEISQEEQVVRDADFKSRHVQFDKQLKDLLTKYELRLEAEPFVYRGMLVAKPTISDMKKYEEDIVEEKTPATVEEVPTVEGEDKK